MRNFFELIGLTFGVSGCIFLIFILLFFKPIVLMGLIWILHHWCDFTLIPILTFWQALIITWIFALLTHSIKNK